MRRFLCSLAILLMAGAVLADEPLIRLGEPESFPEEPGRISASAASRPIIDENPAINFGFDEATGKMKHSHRCEGCRMKRDEWHFHACADPRCTVKIPNNLELCSKCGWSFCQCQFDGKQQLSGQDAERMRETRVRQAQFQARGQAPLEPIPEGTIVNGPTFPSQGFGTGAPQYGQPGCCESHAQPRRGTIASGGVNAGGFAVGAGATYARRGWWQGCAPKPLLGGNVRLGHLRFGTGFDWVP